MKTKEQIIDKIDSYMNMALGAIMSAIACLNSDKNDIIMQKIDAESFVDCVGNYIKEIKKLMVKL